MSTDNTWIDPSAYTDPPHQVEVVPFWRHIRERPAMYVGSCDQRGLQHLVLELVSNSIEEWLVGRCRRIVVKLSKDGGCCVYDDGPGISVDHVTGHNQRFVELVFMGDRIRSAKTGSIRINHGLHGYGLKAVAALSSKLELQVARAGELWTQEYRQGLPSEPLQCLGDIQETFTRIAFWPDPEIFHKHAINGSVLAERLRELAFLHPGLHIEFRDENRRTKQRAVFNAPGGVVDFLTHVNRDEKAIHAPVLLHTETKNSDDSPSVYDVALQWTDSDDERILSFANTANTQHGGTHVAGLRRGVSLAVRKYVPGRAVFPDESPKIDDVTRGLNAVVSVRIPEPHWYGSTKSRLQNPEVRTIVQRMARDQFLHYLETHPAEAQAILERIRRGRG